MTPPRLLCSAFYLLNFLSTLKSMSANHIAKVELFLLEEKWGGVALSETLYKNNSVNLHIIVNLHIFLSMKLILHFQKSVTTTQTECIKKRIVSDKNLRRKYLSLLRSVRMQNQNKKKPLE